jgi:hypothetical protein
MSDEDPYVNGLKWIAHTAAVHYMGQAFQPIHMKGLADLALTVLAGDDLPDFDEAMAAARQRGKQQWEALGFADDGVALVDADELEKTRDRDLR